MCDDGFVRNWFCKPGVLVLGLEWTTQDLCYRGHLVVPGLRTGWVQRISVVNGILNNIISIVRYFYQNIGTDHWHTVL